MWELKKGKQIKELKCGKQESKVKKKKKNRQGCL
jgi:hypothetical protein